MKTKSFILCTGVLTLIAQASVAQFADTPDFVLDGLIGPFNFAVGDLNNDGKPDLVVTSWVRLPGAKEAYDDSKSCVNVYFQKEGRFRASPDKSLSVKNPIGLAFGDFDKDRRNDLVVGVGRGLHVFLGSENLTRDHGCVNINGGGSTVRACNLNKEGLCDFLSGPVWMKWHGADQFKHGYVSGPAANDNGDTLTTDFNHDGETDILTKSRDNKTLRILYGPMLAMMVRPKDLWQFTTLTAPLPLSSMAVGDLNGDGRTDIIVSAAFHTEGGRRKTFIYNQNSPLNFTDDAHPSVTIEGICGELAVADVNGDGLDDLVIAEAATTKTHVFLQKKSQPFATSARDADRTLMIGNNHHVILADLNDDGLPDLIHTDGRSTVRVSLNNTSRTPR